MESIEGGDRFADLEREIDYGTPIGDNGVLNSAKNLIKHFNVKSFKKAEIYKVE